MADATMDASQVRTGRPRHSDRPGTKPKAERIALRVSSEEHSLLEEASRVEGRTLSAFVLDAAARRAEDVLADRRSFRLPPEQWDAFVAMLDRPVVAKPRLAASLRAETIFDDSAR
jgi:uncharacterized protein (DUF1778 family)